MTRLRGRNRKQRLIAIGVVRPKNISERRDSVKTFISQRERFRERVIELRTFGYSRDKISSILDSGHNRV